MQASWTATDMPTSLRGIANRARREKAARFRDLYRLLNRDNLRHCFRALRKDAAAGVDRVTYADYAKGLEDNLEDLVERLKGKRYRAKLVRRRHIPKGDGKKRPLGIPALEDKLLQLAVSRILNAIYEEDFLDCSWGYRPKRGPREASRELADELYRGRYGWVVEADIRSFFDRIDHEHLMSMLERRIDDKAFLRLIRKWLRAGILEEDGKVLHPATGTPQGGVVSPILANVYLHYVLDLWVASEVRAGCRGSIYMLRFADDFVCAFQYRDEAERFLAQLPLRLEEYGLEVAASKTRMVRFSRHDDDGSGGFDFLGFEFRWVQRRTGKKGVQRRTAPSKLRASLRAFSAWLREHRHRRLRDLMGAVSRKLRGYWNYYGVRGNMPSLNRLYQGCIRLLYKWLNRRSQRRSFTWAGLQSLLHHLPLPGPRIAERPRRYGPSLL